MNYLPDGRMLQMSPCDGSASGEEGSSQEKYSRVDIQYSRVNDGGRIMPGQMGRQGDGRMKFEKREDSRLAAKIEERKEK